jgi:hypothetical protein
VNGKQAHFDWAFGLAWLVTCAVGVAIGGRVAFATIWSVGELVDNVAAAALAAGGLFGALFSLGVAVGPGSLLQRKGISAARWLATSAVAGTLGTAAGFVLAFGLFDGESMSVLAFGLFIGLSLGLPLGIGQLLALRKRGAALVWPLITAAAFVLAFVIGIPLGGEGREWLSLGVIGLVLGGLTGLGMVWLLRRQTAVAA